MAGRFLPSKKKTQVKDWMNEVKTATSVLQTKVEVTLQVSKARIAFPFSQNQTGRVFFYALISILNIDMQGCLLRLESDSAW